MDVKIEKNQEMANAMVEIIADKALTIAEYNGNNISFARKDDKTVMINATEMAKPFGKQPIDWMKTDAANAFINEFSKLKNISLADIQVVRRGGNNPGTWLHEDVAMEFARWLSPAFAIWCNDRIKELLTTGKTILPSDYLSALKALVAAEEEKQRLEIENKQMRPKVEYFDNLVERNLLTNFRDTAKELHVNERKFTQWLVDKNLLYRDAKGKLKPYAEAASSGLFEIKEWQRGKGKGTQTLITPKGRETIRLLLKGCDDLM